MNKLIFPFLILIIVACENIEPEVDHQLVSETIASSGLITNYEYDNQGRIIKIDRGPNSYSTEFEYSKNLLSKIRIGSLSIYLLTHFDSDSTQISRVYEEGNTVLQNTLYYDIHGNVDSLFSPGDGSTLVYILDQNSNIIGARECTINSSLCCDSLKYDSHNNIYSFLPIEYRILFGINTGANNLIQYVHCLNPNRSKEYIYSFDVNQNPSTCILKEIKEQGIGAQPEITIDTVLYVYQ